MTFNYVKTAGTSNGLIAKFGQALTVTQSGGGAYNPETGEVGAGGGGSVAGLGAALDYRQKEIDGTLIQAGDRKIFIAPSLGITPATGDIVTLSGGEKLRVVMSKPLAPSGIIVLHEVQARGI